MSSTHNRAAARSISGRSTREARRRLAELYLRSAGGALRGDVSKLFGWALADIDRATGDLVRDGVAIADTEVEGQPGKWIVLRELV